MTPDATSNRPRSLIANGLAVVGIAVLVVATGNGIERAFEKKEREVLEKNPPVFAAGSAVKPETPLPMFDPPAQLSPSPVSPLPKVASDDGNVRTNGEAGLEKSPARSDAPAGPSKPGRDRATASSEPASDPFASGPTTADAVGNSDKDLATARSELVAVTAEIERERQRWKDALDMINSLTANKTRPVKEGSAAYHRCMEASKVIHEVETGAPDLKARKAQLEAKIEQLKR